MPCPYYVCDVQTVGISSTQAYLLLPRSSSMLS